MTDADYRQAVTAIATMIDLWWTHHHAPGE
jgi:hypothetical protein